MEELIQRDVLAQDIMDLYHQQIVDDEGDNLFDLEFFIRQVDESYAALLREEFKQARRERRTLGEESIDIITIDSAWVRPEVVDIEKAENGLFKATLSSEVFSFGPYDTSSAGIQDIQPVKFGECNLIRTTSAYGWKKKHLPKNSITWYWPEGNDIYFTANCCKKVKILHIPVSSGELSLDKGLANAIKEYVLRLMKLAKDGTLPDMINDGNPIVTPKSANQ